jgi:hypothetical protein
VRLTLEIEGQTHKISNKSPANKPKSPQRDKKSDISPSGSLGLRPARWGCARPAGAPGHPRRGVWGSGPREAKRAIKVCAFCRHDRSELVPPAGFEPALSPPEGDMRAT